MNEYARVVWTVEDVKQVAQECGYCLTDEQAEEFLVTNERHLQDRIVELGYEVLQSLFDMEDKDDYTPILNPDTDVLYAVDGAHGQYAPQVFAQLYGEQSTMSADDKQILLTGPEHEYYWETWDTVLENVTVTCNDVTYNIYPGESGDVFLVRADREWPDDFTL